MSFKRPTGVRPPLDECCGVSIHASHALREHVRAQPPIRNRRGTPLVPARRCTRLQRTECASSASRTRRHSHDAACGLIIGPRSSTARSSASTASHTRPASHIALTMETTGQPTVRDGTPGIAKPECLHRADRVRIVGQCLRVVDGHSAAATVRAPSAVRSGRDSDPASPGAPRTTARSHETPQRSHADETSAVRGGCEPDCRSM